MNTTTTAATSSTPTQDRVVYRAELRAMLNNIGSEAIRRQLKRGALPPPDVATSRKTMGWKLSTLHKAGVGVVG